jgi:alanyl-tRNA synthetase
VAESRIYFLGKEDNWWSPGANGPCGPDTEMFYDLTESGLGNLTQEQFLQAVRSEEIVEIWNDVFMEYEQKEGKVIGKLKQKNVDTGAGLERITAVMQGKKTAYDTDLFLDAMTYIKENATNYNEKSARIIADHVKTAVFMISEGIFPSGTERGSVLRKLIRRAIDQADFISMSQSSLGHVSHLVVEKYKNIYREVNTWRLQVLTEINNEIKSYRNNIQHNFPQIHKFVENGQITGTAAFHVSSTLGIKPEVIFEQAKEIKRSDNFEKEFQEAMSAHQALSRAGAEKKFKGGLADHSDKVCLLYTSPSPRD